jgi:hypothetical protein
MDESVGVQDINDLLYIFSSSRTAVGNHGQHTNDLWLLLPLLYIGSDSTQYWLYTIYFMGDFNETLRVLCLNTHLQMCQVSLKNV